jgi:hypothetical protein
MTIDIQLKELKTNAPCTGKSEYFSSYTAQVQICECTSKGEVLMKKFALLYVSIQPLAILKHTSVAMNNLLGSHYGQLNISDTFSSFSYMHTELKPSQATPNPIILFSTTLMHRNVRA